MPGADGDRVPDGTPLTQVGHVKLRDSLNWSRINLSFRCGLSPGDEGYLSLLEGRVLPEEAVPLVAPGDQAGSADCVRFTTADALRGGDERFTVVYKPFDTIPTHVAVYPAGEWDEELSGSFNRCFVEYVRGVLNE